MTRIYEGYTGNGENEGANVTRFFSSSELAIEWAKNQVISDQATALQYDYVGDILDALGNTGKKANYGIIYRQGF